MVTSPVRVVHVVAKTHLDLGFTASAAEVAARYVEDFFPRAMATAEVLRRGDGPARLVWTTGSWILRHALTAGDPAGCRRVADAVRRGDLAWHGLPFTTHTELADAQLVRAGLDVSAGLDERFGHNTAGAKMTDVPGHTRALVPLLAEAGITFLHLGVNPAWPVPDVPPVFRWQAPGGEEVVVAYQGGGYGGEVHIDGCDEVLTFLHTGDNLGPPNVDEVIDAHRALAERFPGAEVRASTLDAFARAVARSVGAARLPVVTAEIGDPWLFGAGSDPQKVAAFRALLRARRHLPEQTPEAQRTEIDQALLLVAEHTWGLDEKATLGEDRRWDRAGLAVLRASPEGQRFEASWREQRAYVDRAAALMRTAGDSTVDPARSVPVAPETAPPVPPAPSTAPATASRDVPVGSVDAWVASVPRSPLTEDGPGVGLTPVPPGTVVGDERWQLRVDPRTGALDQLVHRPDGRLLGGLAHPIGRVCYQSFDEHDYERFYRALSPAPEDEWWAPLDNTKPGIDACGARSGTWHPEVTGSWHGRQPDGAGHTMLIRSAFAPALTDALGAPPEVWSRWSWRTGRPEIELDLWWPHKAASRLPEALWCEFVPVVAEPDRWMLDKLGQLTSPLDVVARGGRALHAVGEGMAYRGPDGPLSITTLDAPLVSPGRSGLLDADPPLPDLARGFGVLLADNCWGTNFPMWISGPARFRFTLAVG